ERYQTEIVTGRKQHVAIAGSEEKRDADMVIVAMGFAGPEPDIINALGIKTTKSGLVQTMADGYRTSDASIFCAGDMRRGQSLVVWALKEGRDAAIECHQYLNDRANEIIRGSVKD
ncbi:MAG: FAD-dependent oxidoreductase, partial [Coriobacteriales bacterium]|nr:FAD-dependent oxidoreductase [Coriobacteriales bacterium]